MKKLFFSTLFLLFSLFVQAEKIYEFEGSANLNTSPITVSNLKGDTYDYSFIIFNDGGSDSNSEHMYITLNSDTGANYESYVIRGHGTTKAVSNTTTDNEMNINQFLRGTNSRNCFLVGVITGDSSQDRILKTIHCTGQPRISQGYCIWNNNVDELTSITFTPQANDTRTWHIVVYRSKKKASTDTWRYIGKLDWSASSTEQSFTNLKGNSYKQYLIDWNSESAELNVEVNNQTTSYSGQLIKNTGSGFIGLAGSTTNFKASYHGKMIINTESGQDRTAISISGGNSGGDKQFWWAGWWNDTTTEITSLYLTPTASTTATAKLYRRKNPNSSTPDIFKLPFKKIAKHEVNSEDFTAGYTFSGLDSTNVLVYRIEWSGLKDNLRLEVRTNGDSGASDFAWQRITGAGTAESAGNDTADSVMRFIGGGDTAEQCHGVMYIYPKSGEYRPALSYSIYDEDAIQLNVGWRLDTTTEITSLQVLSSATTTVNGTFTLSALYK